MQVEEYVKYKGWEYKEAISQLSVKVCPFCNNENNKFYISKAHGAWDCKVCNEKGSFWGLKQRLGDNKNAKIYNFNKIKPIEITPKMEIESIQWLESRGISKKTIEDFGLICEKTKVGFVYKTLDKIPYVIKWRSIHEKKFMSEPSGIQIALPYNAKKHDSKQLIICEGEIDCLTWHEYGFKSVVSLPGAGTFKKEWLSYFKNYNEIFLSLDMDEVGQSKIKEYAEKLGSWKVKNIELPFNDINECKTNGLSKEDIKEIVEDRKEIKSPNIISASEVILKKPTMDDFGITTGYTELDKLTKWRTHELTAFTADTKQGKSTFCVNLIKQQLQRDIPCLIGAFELGVAPTHRKMASMMYDMSFYEMTDYDLNQWNMYENKKLPLYYIKQYGGNSLQKIKNEIYYAVKKYGIKFVLLDHLHFFAQMKGDNLAFEIGNIMKEIKLWTMELPIHIFMVVHPKSMPDGKEPSENDMRGSSDIKQICDNVFSIMSDKENDNMKLTLRISRHELAKTGSTNFDFNTRTLNYINNIPFEFKG